MNTPFHFKQFSITQTENPHKVGTDSVLLGAWTKGDYSKILDIGTGTGILALMLAQKFPQALITAIEPHPAAFQEAKNNFTASPFADRIKPIQTDLQNFSTTARYDLIICNPPYFDGSYLSSDEDRNKARHTADLAIYELYEYGAELLNDNGKFNVIVPFTEETEHIERAYDQGLYIQQILHTLKPNGERKRSLISFGFDEIDPKQSSMLVKDEHNKYSSEYIELTRDFYKHDLGL